MKKNVAGKNIPARQAGRAKKNMEEHKMKKEKMYSLPIVTAFMMLVLAGMVSAGTCVFNTPGASAVLSGASNIININATTAPILNCTVTAASAASGGSFTVGTFTNSTNVTANGTFTTAGQRDAADWVFTATCKNSTGSTIDTCTRTGLTIDNTVPVVSTCLIGGSAAASGAVGSSDATFACTVKNATSCTAYWKGTGLAYTTGTASRSDLSLSAFVVATTYGASGLTASAYLHQIDDNAANAYIACTDGTNTTTGTTYAISTEGFSKAQKQIKQNLVTGNSYYVGQRNDNGKVLVVVIAIAILFLLVALLVANKKK